MPNKISLENKVFGRLTVLREGPKQNQFLRWYCRCECGNETLVLAGSLMAGRSRSCGCLSAEMRTAGVFNLRHGGRHTREYRIWCNAKARCYNANTAEYERYGGRGIRMCKEWREDFAHFFQDMGPCPPGKSLERIDTDKHYTKNNCTWATRIEQMNNMSRNVWLLCSDGVKRTLAQLARHTGVNYGTLRSRYLKHGARYVSQV